MTEEKTRAAAAVTGTNGRLATASAGRRVSSRRHANGAWLAGDSPIALGACSSDSGSYGSASRDDSASAATTTAVGSAACLATSTRVAAAVAVAPLTTAIRSASTTAGTPTAAAAAARWCNLKNVIRVTNFKPRKSGDEFLERFSTRRLPVDDAAAAAAAAAMNAAGSSAGVGGAPFGGDASGGGRGDGGESEEHRWTSLPRRFRASLYEVIDPDGDVVFGWLACVTVFVVYNLWTIILREGFPACNEWGETRWLALDSIADIVFAADVAVQMRTGYLEHGIVVTEWRRLVRRYVRSRDFWFDVVSLVPSEYLFGGGVRRPIARLPRLLKIHRYFRLSHMAETRTSYPNILRVATSVHTLLLIVHWFAAFYYMLSKYERHNDEWSFPLGDSDGESLTRQYLVSFYWAALTLTTIGDLPGPVTNWQYVFQIASYMIGLFIFATIVGQVGNVISNYTASRQEFERQLDGAKIYMQRHGVPKELQTRVQRWYDYTWTRNRMIAPGDINSLQLLPDKLKTELALHVNLEILQKVSIFDECEPEFLHDLVLKMKSCIFTPGDFVVRKSEIAREMFIIADGVLEVLGDTGEVIAKLTAGNFFGEIGILNLEGGINRRTADVRSVGYSDLFVLERDAVVMAIQQYPQAESSLMKHANRRLQEMKRIGSDRQATVTSVTSQKLTVQRQTDGAHLETGHAFHCRSLSVDAIASSCGCRQLSEAVRECNENIKQLRSELETYSHLFRRVSQNPGYIGIE